MVVELDVFSGRPNPRWELDEKKGATLTRLEASLHRADRVPPAPPGLGYRGFKYTGPGGINVVYKGFVRTPSGILADPLFAIERFLVGTLPDDFASLAEAITRELHTQ
jgi:hypothetical protein